MSDFEAHLEALRERFRTRLCERLEALRAAARQETANPGDRDVTLRIRTLAHDLAGSSGTFGFPDLGEIAAALEDVADRALAGPGEDHGLAPAVRRLAAAIEATIAGA